MRRTRFLLALSAVAVLGIGFYGCSNPDSTESTPAANTADDHDHDGDDDHGHEHGDADGEHSSKTDAEKAVEGLASLSDEDRAAAEKQKTCPVSGELLGVEGTPVMATVKDQEIWVCCEGCKNELLDEPDKYLAKTSK